jgi:hypothetical protein
MLPGAVVEAPGRLGSSLRWVGFHLLIFGGLFVAIVLLLSGGLAQKAAHLRHRSKRA